MMIRQSIALLTLTLPQPRPHTSIRFTGSYRVEGYCVDHSPSVLDYVVATSTDGTTWQDVATRQGHIPEEQGPQWIAFDGKPLKSVLIHMKRNVITSSRYERGVAHLQCLRNEGP